MTKRLKMSIKKSEVKHYEEIKTKKQRQNGGWHQIN